MSPRHVTGSLPVHFCTLLLPALLVLVVHSTPAWGQAGTSSPAVNAEVGAPASKAPSDPPMERRRRSRGALSDGDMERLVGVASDISPEWASSLRARMVENPEQARADFRRNGRRLFGLLMLEGTRASVACGVRAGPSAVGERDAKRALELLCVVLKPSRCEVRTRPMLGSAAWRRRQWSCAA